jgi:DNA-binding NarL/FixJ family response regulator
VPARCNGLDLVLTRLEMPSVTGEDLLEKLRRGRPYLKAIAVADSTLTEDELAAAGRAGFTEIIASPLEPDILAHLVRRVLGRE